MSKIAENEIHVLEIVLKHAGDVKTVGVLGRFTDEELFKESYKRASEKVIPMLNNVTIEGYNFELNTYWVILNSYNYCWENEEVIWEMLCFNM